VRKGLNWEKEQEKLLAFYERLIGRGRRGRG